MWRGRRCTVLDALLQRGRLVEDLCLERLECRAGFQAQLFGEMDAGALIDLQRLGLTPRAVQREHQLAAEPLAQRMLTHQRLELTYERGLTSERKIRLDPILHCSQPRLLETRHVALGERFIGEVRKRRAAP